MIMRTGIIINGDTKKMRFRIFPLEANVTGMSHNEVVEKFGEVFGFKNRGKKLIAQVGYVQITTGGRKCQ